MFRVLLSPVRLVVGLVNTGMFILTLSCLDVIVILYIWHLKVKCIEVKSCDPVVKLLY